jgi:sec-independent protein translocase protein TatC
VLGEETLANESERGEKIDPELEAGSMSILEHLDELRNRLVHTVIAVFVATAIAFVFIQQIMAALLVLVPSDVMVVTLTPTERFVTYMKVAFVGGAGISMPVIIYEVISYIAPGLRRKEKKIVYLGLPFVVLCFIGGVLFGYYLVVPRALDFLLHFGSTDITAQVQLAEYFGFMSTFLFWLGVVFEMPVFIFFMAKIGVLTVQRLNKWRKYAYLVMIIIAAIITPTPDPVNQMIVAVPMIALYEIGGLLARLA